MTPSVGGVRSAILESTQKGASSVEVSRAITDATVSESSQRISQNAQKVSSLLETTLAAQGVGRTVNVQA